MNPLAKAAALLAAAAHEVVAEYRRLDAPPPPPEPARQEMSCTSAATQVNTADPRRAYRDGRVSPPFGFGKDGR